MTAGFAVDDVGFSYRNRPVLQGVNLTVEPGHFYGILGPNGCGKSTFLDLLMGHQQPHAGRLRYNERDMAAFSRRELAREMALVPQNFHVNFPFTAADVVAMGRYPHMPRFSAPSAEDLELVDRVMVLTGTDGFRDRYLTEMSGGERQRVVFARALAQETPVLLLDEATSNLDINHSLTLLDIVRDRVRKEGRTVVAVFQDMNMAAAFCDRLIWMKDGAVIDAGDTDAVLTAENIYTVFGVEAHVSYDSFSRARKVSFKR